MMPRFHRVSRDQNQLSSFRLSAVQSSAKQNLTDSGTSCRRPGAPRGTTCHYKVKGHELIYGNFMNRDWVISWQTRIFKNSMRWLTVKEKFENSSSHHSKQYAVSAYYLRFDPDMRQQCTHHNSQAQGDILVAPWNYLSSPGLLLL